jgi:NAD(P)-dependent dehydrogenase (short-subunit alcohol dehydrogenase family)
MTLHVLEGQRAIVTGANSGIGEGVARVWPRPAPKWW